jgi:hypothetical protein
MVTHHARGERGGGEYRSYESGYERGGDAGARGRRRGMAGRGRASELSSINSARLKMAKYKVTKEVLEMGVQGGTSRCEVLVKAAM